MPKAGRKTKEQKNPYKNPWTFTNYTVVTLQKPRAVLQDRDSHRCRKPGMGIESKENTLEAQNADRQAVKQKESSHGLESWWLALQITKRSEGSGWHSDPNPSEGKVSTPPSQHVKPLVNCI